MSLIHRLCTYFEILRISFKVLNWRSIHYSFKNGKFIFSVVYKLYNGQRAGGWKLEGRSFFWASLIGAGGQGLAPSCSAFQATSRKLDQKWNSWDSNQHPYGMLALRVKNRPSVLPHQPLLVTLVMVTILYYELSFQEADTVI